MDVARSESVEALWQESVRRYNARRDEEMRAAWCEYHREQAAPEGSIGGADKPPRE
jgi:hypothetical protein